MLPQFMATSRFIAVNLAAMFAISLMVTSCSTGANAETYVVEEPAAAPLMTHSDTRNSASAEIDSERIELPEATAVPPDAIPSLTAITAVPTRSLPEATAVSPEAAPSLSAVVTSPEKHTPEAGENLSETSHTSELVSEFEFEREYVDTKYGGNGKPGWVRAGDMDKDGDVDIVAGGGRALFIYENDGNAGGWMRYGSLDGTGEIGANGAVLYDVDNDGDLDVVSAKYYSQLGWWENPGGSLKNDLWQFHAFSDETWFLHDIIVVDLDKDGMAEEFVTNLNNSYWDANIKVKWFLIGADAAQPWESHTIEKGRGEGAAHGHAGIDTGDIDKDGHPDVAFSNGWYEAPDNLLTEDWTWHPVSNIYGISNTLVGDMDGDSDLDMLVSGGHHGQGVFWLENDGNPKSGFWKQHNISDVIGNETSRHYYKANAPDHLHHPECLALEDMDGDGDRDVIACDLYFGEDPGEPRWNEEKANVYIIENLGSSASWKKHNIAPNSYPSHLLQMVDVNRDGQLDIISESAGHSVVSYYENTTFGAILPTSTSVPTISPTSLPSPTQTPVVEAGENPIFLPVAVSGQGLVPGKE